MMKLWVGIVAIATGCSSHDEIAVEANELGILSQYAQAVPSLPLPPGQFCIALLPITSGNWMSPPLVFAPQ